MVNVKLHGIFEEYVKTEWKLNVRTISEIFEAIEANSGKLLQALGNFQEYLTHFIIYVDDKPISVEYINSPILKKRFESRSCSFDFIIIRSYHNKHIDWFVINCNINGYSNVNNRFNDSKSSKRY